MAHDDTWDVLLIEFFRMVVAVWWLLIRASEMVVLSKLVAWQRWVTLKTFVDSEEGSESFDCGQVVDQRSWQKQWKNAMEDKASLKH